MPLQFPSRVSDPLHWRIPSPFPEEAVASAVAHRAPAGCRCVGEAYCSQPPHVPPLDGAGDPAVGSSRREPSCVTGQSPTSGGDRLVPCWDPHGRPQVRRQHRRALGERRPGLCCGRVPPRNQARQPRGSGFPKPKPCAGRRRQVECPHSGCEATRQRQEAFAALASSAHDPRHSATLLPALPMSSNFCPSTAMPFQSEALALAEQASKNNDKAKLLRLHAVSAAEVLSVRSPTVQGERHGPPPWREVLPGCDHPSQR